MGLPRRKPNRLKNYDYSQNCAYFITICVKERHELLCQIVGGDAHIDPCVQLSEYGMVADKYIRGVTGIDKYVIMPNHIHMIICVYGGDGTMRASSPTQSISQLIKSFKILVTKQIGFSLWQRSFHDHIIRSQQEYQKIWEYIDTNPLKWADDCFYEKV
ncbi:MAG: transposase [Oscillospiraceae bacterium]